MAYEVSGSWTKPTALGSPLPRCPESRGCPRALGPGPGVRSLGPQYIYIIESFGAPKDQVTSSSSELRLYTGTRGPLWRSDRIS